MKTRPALERKLRERKIIDASARCVEALLATQEKNAERRPWVIVVEEHMKALVEDLRLHVD